jgi:hypothetical protein
MANEGALIFNLTLNPTSDSSPASFQARPRQQTYQFDVSGSDAIQRIFTIGTTDTVLDLSAVGQPGYIFFHNTDPTNFVTFGDDGTRYPGNLRANGGIAILEWNQSSPNIHMIADTAPCDVEALIFPQ